MTTKKNNGDKDRRFDRVTNDPKFTSSTKVSKTSNKVEVDDRFKAMFKDEEFQAGKALKIDKYGRKINKKDDEDSFLKLSRHYKLKEDEADRLDQLTRLSRGEIIADNDESSSTSSTTSDNESDEDEDEELLEEETKNIVMPEFRSDSTKRLAIMSCDWDNVRALDLLAILRSFVPRTGTILDVAVYSSEYGRKKMALEDVHGPFVDSSKVVKEDLEDEEEEEDITKATEAGNNFNPNILRRYEQNRLLYYFAIVTCDSAETADVLYKECDGIEFEHSSIALDLRFVPDDIKFDVEHLRDRAGDVPETYAPIDFVNKSLQQSSVELSWDEPKYDRRKLEFWNKSTKKNKGEGVSLEELEAFIASDESDLEEDDDDEAKRKSTIDKYRKLLQSSSKLDEHNDKVVEEDFADENPKSSISRKKKEAKNHKPDNLEEEDIKEDNKKRGKSHKKKMNKNQEQGDDEQREIDVDLEDVRFAPLLTDSEFVLDRTDPRFKANATTKKIDEAKRKRRRNE